MVFEYPNDVILYHYNLPAAEKFCCKYKTNSTETMKGIAFMPEYKQIDNELQ